MIGVVLTASQKINVFGSMPMLTILGDPQSGVKFARASFSAVYWSETETLAKRGARPLLISI
jgi:hypothetical protein